MKKLFFLFSVLFFILSLSSCSLSSNESKSNEETIIKEVESVPETAPKKQVGTHFVLEKQDHNIYEYTISIDIMNDGHLSGNQFEKYVGDRRFTDKYKDKNFKFNGTWRSDTFPFGDSWKKYYRCVIQNGIKFFVTEDFDYIYIFDDIVEEINSKHRMEEGDTFYGVKIVLCEPIYQE